jgi:cytochrome c553
MTLALLLLACSGQQAAEEVREEVIDAMEAHWDDAEDMRDAAIAGDVEAYRKAATALHDRLPVKGLAEELKPMQQVLKDAALKAHDANTSEDMGSTLGSVIAACGTCHEAADVRPLIEPTPPPPVKGAEPPLEMLWHQLGAIELWVAIVRHDDEEWAKGIDKLQRAHFKLDDGTASGAERDALEARAQAIVEKAHEATDTAVQAEAFGRLIATCSACHEAGKETAEVEAPPDDGGEKEKKGKKGKKK